MSHITRTCWTKVDTDETLVRALAACKGTYQRGLVKGVESISGSTLKGKARSWGGRYAQSRMMLLSRLRRVGLKIEVETVEHGARILVIKAAA